MTSQILLSVNGSLSCSSCDNLKLSHKHGNGHVYEVHIGAENLPEFLALIIVSYTHMLLLK